MRCSISCVSSTGFSPGVLRGCEAAFTKNGEMDQRAAIRAPVEGFVQVTIRDREVRAPLRNLSASGCLIEMTDPACLEGDQVVVSLIDGVEVCGRLVWKVPGLAGVEFVERIHPVLVEHLKVKPSLPRLDSWLPRDRFGRALRPR